MIHESLSLCILVIRFPRLHVMISHACVPSGIVSQVMPYNPSEADCTSSSKRQQATLQFVPDMMIISRNRLVDLVK